MSDLPEEAVQAATAAYRDAWLREGVLHFPDLVRVALKAAAPAIAAHERADERRKVAEEIAAHFDDMVVTREYRRRFEDRHAEHLAKGVTAHGLLSAVVDEIKALPERTETDA